MSPHELFVKLNPVNLYFIEKQLKVLASQDNKSNSKFSLLLTHNLKHCKKK